MISSQREIVAPAEALSPAGPKKVRLLGALSTPALALLARHSALAALLGIMLLGLVLRLPDLGLYTVGDESRWVQRANDFGTRVSRGQDEQTFLIGHPGVTVMWTALAGMVLDDSRRMTLGVRGTDVTRNETYLRALVSARRGFVVSNTLLLLAVVLLFWRLAGAAPALLAGLLLSADPFLLAHSQLVHLDATLSGYMSVAMLSALVFWWAGGSLGYLILSGITAGLALLTKSPAVYLLVFVPALGIAGTVMSGQRERRSMLRLTGQLVAWAGLASGVAFLLWPALRARPLPTLRNVIQFSLQVGEAGHDNFFLGAPTDAPGLVYYPFVLAFRLGLGVMLGLFMLVLWRRSRTGHLWLVPVLLLYALGFWLMMNLGSKKFDRYALPLVPILALLAAIGWWSAYRRLAPKVGRWAGVLVGLLALSLQVIPALAVRPYYLAYYNPLLGGGPAAARTILVGWGEGLDLAAEYINAQPEGARARVAIAEPLRENLQAPLDGLVVRRVGGATYLVDYVSGRQRDDIPIPLGQVDVLERPPERSFWINGIEYIRIYRLAG